jgi:LacI family transcriptional regulator
MTWTESGVLKGFLQAAARHRDWDVAVEAWNEIPPRGPAPDGVLVRGSASRRRGRKATVCIGRERHAARVWVDDREIGRIAARHLISRGFDTLAYRGDDRYLVSRERRDGFFEEAERTAATCIDLSRTPEDWSIAEERRDTTAALARCPRPLGLLAFTSHVGRRVLACVDPEEVPNRIAVVAGDRDPLVSEACHPTLTGVDFDVHRMGIMAGELMADLLAGKRPPAEPILLKPEGIDKGRSGDGRAVDDPIVLQALKAIADGAMRVPDLVAATGVSRRTLELHFASTIGEAPAVMIRRRRLAQALDRLRSEDAPVTHIAKACGWTSAARFAYDIRQATGKTPQAWRLSRRHDG